MTVPISRIFPLEFTPVRDPASLIRGRAKEIIRVAAESLDAEPKTGADIVEQEKAATRIQLACEALLLLLVSGSNADAKVVGTINAMLDRIERI